MNIPEQVIIGGIPFKIEMNPILTSESGDTCFGMCNNSEMVIKLHSGQPQESLQHTFFHEIIHAICNVYNIKSEGEEEWIRHLVTPLYDTLTRNGIL